MAWMPSLTRRPEELTAANGASSTIESLAFFVGPALGALLVSTTSVEVVFLLNAATFLLSAVLVWGIHPVAGPTPGDDDGDESHSGSDFDSDEPEEKVGAFAEMASGFQHIRRDRDLTMVAILVCAQTIVAGATIVFGVAFAVEILETGPAGVGIIDSVFGVGAILGGFYAIARSTRNRLAGDLALGTALWSLPLLLVVAYPSPATVFASAVLLGFGNPLVDVNFATIVQRLTPNAVLGRVFGAYEGALIATMALGSAVMPFLISGLGLRWALAVLALVVGVPALAFLPRCLALDATLRAPAGTSLLRGIAIFSPLAPAKIEALASMLTTETASAGTAVVREGEVSDRFLVVVSGRVEVTQGGEAPALRGPRRVLRRDRPAARRATHRHGHCRRGHHSLQPGPRGLPGCRPRSRRVARGGGRRRHEAAGPGLTHTASGGSRVTCRAAASAAGRGRTPVGNPARR